MRIAFYGSSLLSSYWNGAATYYRGLLAALSPLGYDITFYEPDAFDSLIAISILLPGPMSVSMKQRLMGLARF